MSTDPARPVRLTVIVGSARDGRLAPRIGRWFVDQLDGHDDLDVEVIDVADTPLPGSLDSSAPEVVALRARLAPADAFVVVAPEYNRSIPGPLKTLIDCANAEWQAKPVAFVSYGLSVSGGVRAIEHLRQIFGEFHCVTLKETVQFPRIMQFLDGGGNFVPDAGAGAAVKLMIDQLRWWARSLRDAKTVRPYGI